MEAAFIVLFNIHIPKPRGIASRNNRVINLVFIRFLKIRTAKKRSTPAASNGIIKVKFQPAENNGSIKVLKIKLKA